MYDIESKTLFVSRDVIFHENSFPFQFLNADNEGGMHFLVPCDAKVLDDEAPIITLPAHDDVEVLTSSDANLTDSEPVLPSVSKQLCPIEDPAAANPHVENHVGLRKSSRSVKPPIWQAVYVLPIQTTTKNCLYSISDVVDYDNISFPYKSCHKTFTRTGAQVIS